MTGKPDGTVNGANDAKRQSILPNAEVLTGWLEVASRAPSYHNLQPWQCALGDRSVTVRLDPERAFHILGRNGRASLLALGSFLENLTVAAAADGYEPILETLDEDNARALTVKARFVEGPPPDDAKRTALAAALARETNRRAPGGGPVSAEGLVALSDASQSVEGCRLFLTQDADTRQELAECLATGATLALYNPQVHDELFAYNRWTEAEAVKHRDGIDARTLEVDAASAAWLQRVAPYEVFASQVDPEAILSGAITPLTTSPHLALLIGPRSPALGSTVQAGRALARMWNRAAAEQIALQPFGVLFLYDLEDRLELEACCDEDELEQVDALLHAAAHLAGATSDEQIYFACRLFQAEAASTRSLRRPVEAFTRPSAHTRRTG